MAKDWTISEQTRNLFRHLNQVGQELQLKIYLVGGYLRDLLLGKEGNDIDFVIIGDAIFFAQNFIKKTHPAELVVYPKFGTCMLHFDCYKLEFVSARTELYADHSRKPHVLKADLYSDLSRRDFTINTMALDLADESLQQVIDPYHGQQDLRDGIIRTPLQPLQTFSDDPLRILRAVRFATQLSFTIEPHTMAGIISCAERLKIISQERITEEFNKILLTKKPSLGIKLLESCNLLPVFLPELIATKGVEQRRDYHHKDVFYHTLQVLDKIAKIPDRLPLRLAALFHDIAKPVTKRFDEETGWTFHGHEMVGEKMVGSILQRMKYSNEIIEYVKKITRLHLRPMALVSDDVTDSAIRRLLRSSGREFDDLMELCRADITSKNPAKIEQHLENYSRVLAKAYDLEQKDKLRAFKSPVDGNEIMQKLNLKPGPQIGTIKKYIEEAILEGIIPNDHDSALAYLLDHKENFLEHRDR
jgi:poly(A) polymerase